MRKITLLLLLFSLTISIFAVDRTIVELFSSDKSANPHGAWINASGEGRVEVIMDPVSGDRIIRIIEAARMKLAFNGHSPLDLSKLPENTFLSFDLKCDKENGPIKITSVWELDQKSKSERKSVKAASGSEWQKVYIPVPAVTAGKSAKALLLILPKGNYALRNIKTELRSLLAADPVDQEAFRKGDRIRISGRADENVKSVMIRSGNRLLAKALVKEGSFAASISREQVPAGECTLTLYPERSDPHMNTEADSVRFYVYPKLGATRLPAVSVKGGKLLRNGKAYAFVGTNFTAFQLGLSNREYMDYRYLVEAVNEMASWKITVVRIPVNVGLLQPAEGVFPDSAEWKEIFRKHRLKTEFFNYLEYFIQLAADHGIYSVIDFHGFPVNPYRYFLGGIPGDQASGSPGTAIAWLANSKTTKRVFPDFSNERELRALCTTFSWIAKHFKGNSNIIGFEIPYNEPHDSYMSVPQNYTRVTEATAAAVKNEDPGRLTFQMPASWGHDNSTWPSTWMLPYGVDGGAPHFYFANGPIGLRPGAGKSTHPWLCRNIDETFSYGMAAVLLPFSKNSYPLYNGENGEHGYESFLPDMEPEKAAEYMIEAGLVQSYAAGLCGSLQWTLWLNPKSFQKFSNIYRRQYRRFSEVFQSGPVDWSNAKVAFIQNVAAEPIQNGHNFSCVPLASLMLDLHLSPVHYLTDDRLIYSELAQFSKGLEQVSNAEFSTDYKALIIDRRNLDQRVVRCLKKTKIPVLWYDDPKELSLAKVKDFLTKAGVEVDARTPSDLQLINGPSHLIIYRRSGEGTKPELVYPRLTVHGSFKLVDESGSGVYEGNAQDLYRKGIRIRLPKWKSLILKIVAGS